MNIGTERYTFCENLCRIWRKIMKRFKGFGFTLAEVLITLGIIGVVAALTIPGLIQTHKANRLHTQFLKSYSTLQQAFRQMTDDDVSVDSRTYNNNTFYNTLKQYFKIAIDCGNYNSAKKYEGCYYKTNANAYKTLNGVTTAYTEDFDDGQFVLMDGTTMLIENASASLIFISVDLNGFNTPPNRWGYDLFSFQFLDGEIKAMGDVGTRYINQNTYCSKTSSSNRNGIACAIRAKNETDYFKQVVKNYK